MIKLVPIDGIPGGYQLKGVPSDEKARESLFVTYRNAAAREKNTFVITRKKCLYVAESVEAKKAIEAKFPITGRGPKSKVSLSEMIEAAKS